MAGALSFIFTTGNQKIKGSKALACEPLEAKVFPVIFVSLAFSIAPGM